MKIDRHITSLGDYCGITALMLLTGLHREELKAVVNLIRKRKPTAGVLGLHEKEMYRTLKILGCKVMGVDFNKRMKIEDLPKNIAAIIVVRRHYVAYHGGHTADTFQWDWRPVEKSIHKKMRPKLTFIISTEAL